MTRLPSSPTIAQMFKTVEWKNGAVRLIDQTKLPTEVVYIDCKDVEVVAEAIKSLRVRGAPAIGITAAFGVALAARQIASRSFDDFYHSLCHQCDLLAETRPTAVNLFWAIDRMKKCAKAFRSATVEIIQTELLAEAERILQEDIAMNKKIGAFGATFIESETGILTHCNAGALATGGYGTALGVIRSAWRKHKNLTIFSGETRPVLQGARLTVWELHQDNIPVTLITDNMAGYFMQQGKIQSCVVGADRIASNGDVANKIGTYGLAVLAKAHDIPFYVAAPTSTVDFTMTSGAEIPIEERDPEEVRAIGGVVLAPGGITVSNPAFDVTPARYITAIITEKGCFNPGEIHKAEK